VGGHTFKIQYAETLFYDDHESPVVIGRVYKPPEPAAHAPTAQLPDELLSVPVSSLGGHTFLEAFTVSSGSRGLIQPVFRR